MAVMRAGQRGWVIGLGAVLAACVCGPGWAEDPDPPPQEEAKGTVGPGLGDHPSPPEHPRGRWRHRRADYRTLPEDVKAELHEFMAEHFPDQYGELARLEDVAPKAFEVKTNRVLPTLLELMRLEQDDPKVFPHKVKSVRFSAQIRALLRRVSRDREGEADPKKVEQLRGLLEKRFDAELKIRRIEVQRLERRLAQARARLDDRLQDKELIVADELDELMRTRRPYREHGPDGKGPRRQRRP
ncbi:MAG: hypothetical protein GY842_03555 [bacterium]|nr:hypothetical protein [bacterium]